MPITSQDSSPLFGGDGAGTLKLVVYFVLSVLLMVSDQRGQFVARVRREASTLAGPMYWLASAPSRGIDAASIAVRDRYRLEAANKALRERNLILEAQINRLSAVNAQNNRLLQLLGARERLGLKAQMARIVDLDLQANRQRVMIDRGRADGVAVGQVALDATGVYGQVSEVYEGRAQVVLLTDPNHALPVMFERAGLRGIAQGMGEDTSLRVPNMPNANSLQKGDRVITSGLGGRFPPGLLVGKIDKLSQDLSTGMTEVRVQVAAGFSTSNELLLIHDEVQILAPLTPNTPEFVGPPSLEQEVENRLVRTHAEALVGANAHPNTGGEHAFEARPSVSARAEANTRDPASDTHANTSESDAEVEANPSSQPVDPQ